jgi:hypothetical protein
MDCKLMRRDNDAKQSSVPHVAWLFARVSFSIWMQLGNKAFSVKGKFPGKALVSGIG